jgi:hypothetical protein
MRCRSLPNLLKLLRHRRQIKIFIEFDLQAEALHQAVDIIALNAGHNVHIQPLSDRKTILVENQNPHKSIFTHCTPLFFLLRLK